MAFSDRLHNLSIVADRQIVFVEQAFSVFGNVLALDGKAIITPDVVRQADVLLVRSVTQVKAALLAGSKVRFIGSATSGTDHIDKNWLGEQDIFFADAAGSNARAVAEYVLSCLYIVAQARTVALPSLTVGIVGCGHVGSQLYRFLTALEVSCLCYDPPLKDIAESEFYCEWADLFEADVISLHVPFTVSGKYPTKHFIDCDFFANCKADMTLINTARGEVVNEADLLAHLEACQFFTAIFDVWKGEPHIARALFERVMIGTAHIAGYTREAKHNASRMLYESLASFLECSTLSFPPLQDSNLRNFCPNEEDDPISSAVLFSYDPRDDYLALKQCIERGGAYNSARADIINEMRIDKSARGEYSSTSVAVDTLTDKQKIQLDKLGFRL